MDEVDEGHEYMDKDMDEVDKLHGYKTLFQLNDTITIQHINKIL